MKLRDLLLVFDGEVIVNYILDEVYFGDSRGVFDCKDSSWFLDNEVMEVIANEDSLIINTR